MTDREDFTDDEWYQLRSAPWQAAMGVIEVDPSGTIATGHEIEAVEAVLAASQFDDGLIGLVTRDLLDLDGAEAGDDRPSAGPTAAAAESAAADKPFPDVVIDAMGPVAALLEAKAPSQSEAFRTWLISVATAAADAGREGFAGLTGPRVSDDEAGYLERLRDALGVS